MIPSTWPSKYFTVGETLHSSIATRKGINNEPDDPVIWGHIIKAAYFMDDVRSILDVPVHVDSWYRNPEVNKLVGGVSTSAHLSGYAIDFVAPRFGDPSEIFQYLCNQEGLVYDQLILEFNSWVHISFAPAMRKQKLVYDGKRYKEIK